jgi:hypothetical protein
VVLPQPRFNFTGDGLEVRLGRGRANDKEIGEAGDSAQIEERDVLRFFVRGELGAGGG